MIKAILFVAVLTLVVGSFARAQEAGGSASSGGQAKILILHFSKTGNTKAVAEQIQARVGGDLFQVATKKPYPEDYRETTRVARVEQDNNARPELAATIPADDMQRYDVIFVGYPNWWGTIPMALFTFLEQYDLSGKMIVPFCTHEGSGLGRGPADIGRLCPDSTVRQGLAVRGGSAGSAQNEVAGWLRQLGYAQ